MSEESDVRNEVHLTNEAVTSTSSFKKTVALKSKDKDMDYLIEQAKKLIDEK